MIRLICFLLAAVFLYAEPPSAVAIRNARIVTVSGPVIEKGTVLLRNGLIEAVGANLTIPPDAWVIEGDKLTVYPGLIDALSTLGLPESAPPAAQPAPGTRSTQTQQQARVRGPQDRPSNTSWLRAADQLNPSDRRIESMRSLGFTSAVAFPTSGIFAGQGAVINLAGDKGGMVVSAPAAQYLTISSGSFMSFPGSLMGVMAYIRQIYLDAGHYRMARERYARSPAGMQRPEYDRALEGVLECPRILLPASRAVELDRMLRLARDLKQPVVLYGGHEAYAAVDLVKQAGVPLLVSLKWPERDRDASPDDVDPLRVLQMRERAPSTPAALAKAGANFALYADGLTSGRDLMPAFKRALDAGLSPLDAVKAMTLAPAGIYGVADRLGSIEKGKIANLVVAEGELFREKTRIKYVFIDGVKFEPVPETPEEVGR